MRGRQLRTAALSKQCKQCRSLLAFHCSRHHTSWLRLVRVNWVLTAGWLPCADRKKSAFASAFVENKDAMMAYSWSDALDRAR